MGRNLKTEEPFHVIGNTAGRKQTLYNVHTVRRNFKGKMTCQNMSLSSIQKEQKGKQKKARNCYVYMELLHSEKVPRLSTEGQTGGALTTRGIKREPDQRDNTSDVKVTKQEDAYQRLDPTVEYGGGKDPLYVADFKKLGPAKRWNKDTLVNQKFILTIDQKRGQKENEDLNIGATHAIAVAIDNLVEELKIPGDYWMTFQIGSREHRKEGLTGET